MYRTRTLLVVPATCLATLLPIAAVAAPPGPQRPEPTLAVEVATALQTPDVRLPSDDALVGRWSVRPAPGEGEPSIGWRSGRPLPMTDARPELRVGNRVVAVPSVTADGRGLTVPLSALAGVDLRRLQVWLGADRLDRRGALAPSLRSGGSAGGFGARVDVLDVDPGVPGPFDVEEGFDYRAAALPWSEFDAPMEVLGHVRFPAGVDDAPLVLILHGRHAACYRPRETHAGQPGARGGSGWPCPGRQQPVPSYLGYDYLQRLLASQGYATVSISANAINAQDFASPDGGAAARSALVRHHLRLIAQWTADPGKPRWSGRVDTDDTVLVGHSRGGEGVARAVVDSGRQAPWDVRGQVLVAPTNFARLATPYTPSVTLLPYCDGDVIDLQGQQYTDLPRDLTSDDTAFRSSVLMRGANHNFFNVQWTPGASVAPSFDDWFDADHPLCGDDSTTRLSPQEQRAAGKAWIAGAVHLFAADDTDVLPMMDAAGSVTVPSAAAAAVRTHALGGDRILVRPTIEGTRSGEGRLCRAVSSGRGTPMACGAGINATREVHWASNLPPAAPVAKELTLTWQGPGVVGGLDLTPPLDLTGADTTLDLRTVVDPELAPARLRVRLSDSDGDSWTAPEQVLPGLQGAYIRSYWGQTLRVDPRAAPPRLDLDSVTSVDLVSGSQPGRVWVLDVAARHDGLLPVPDKRLPQLSLGGRVVVAEGDDPADAVATVSYTLDQPAPAGARLAVSTVAFTDQLVTDVIDVAVPAGATEGTFEVPYLANVIDSPPRRSVFVQAFADENLVVKDATCRVIVTDDDPDARLQVRRAARAVAPGERMVWQLRLDRPTDYDVFVGTEGVVTDPRAGNLRVSDVPARWARQHLGPGVPSSMPLARRLFEFVEVPTGTQVGTVQVPTRPHPSLPGSRSLTLKFVNRLLSDGPVVLSIRRR